MVSLVTSGEGVPTSAILFTVCSLMETTWLSARSERPDQRAVLGRVRAR